MASFVISYDLMNNKDYAQIISRIRALGGKKMLLSMWWVTGNYTASELFNDLIRFIDNDDRLVVLSATAEGFYRNSAQQRAYPEL